MEAHLVHFNAKYGDFKTAINNPDGLVVVAFFIQALGDKDCDRFHKISGQIRNICEPNSKCAISAGKLLLKYCKLLLKYCKLLLKY